MSERFQVVPGSQSCHCCFEWTVVDTSKGRNAYEGDPAFEALCECYEEADARRIAAGLNATEDLERELLDRLATAARREAFDDGATS